MSKVRVLILSLSYYYSVKRSNQKEGEKKGGGWEDLLPDSLFEVFVLLIKSSQFGKT